MFINRRPGIEHLAVIASGTVLGWLGYHGYFGSSTTNSHSLVHTSEGLPQAFETGTQESIPIPPEYGLPYGSADENDQPGACSDTASAEYLRDFRTHAVKQCPSRSGDSIYCFHGTINGQERDAFCIAQNVVLDEETKHFSLECDKRLPDKQSPEGVFDFGEMQRQSGPGAVFERYFDIGWKTESLFQSPLQVEERQEGQSTYTVLINREGTASFWDSLMEIMSMTLSMDILRMSSDIRLGDSFVKVPADLPRAKVIILDDLPEGPLYDMWAFFSASAPIRFKDILDDRTRAEALLSAHTAIVPLPGRSNPLSRVDQNDIPDCRYSGLARTFARRVLRNYGVLYSHGGNTTSKVVRVTLVAGTGPQRIRNTDYLLEALRRGFPSIIAWEVDFAGISMAEQLQIVQSTDVLVGAHGGGLSHMMFMREGEGAVVEIRPPVLSATNHQARYKNLAALLGRKYFVTEAEVVPFGQGGSRIADMEKDNGKDRPKAVDFELVRREMELAISEDDFVAGVGRAIEALNVPGQV